MTAIGTLPKNVSLLAAIDSIGETIIIADKNYNISWMNSRAAQLLSSVAPLFGYNDVKELLGKSMDQFHEHPPYQRKIMEYLDKSHRARITIQNQFVADIIITPIRDKMNETQGFVVMLMDVTTKAEEDKEKEMLIQALSVPMISIWKHTLALPLIGKFDKERADLVISSVLQECTGTKIHYVLIDLNGLYAFEDETKFELQKLNDCLNLIGTQCILVGMTPKLAMTAGDLNKNILSFHTAYDGLQHIMKIEK